MADADNIIEGKIQTIMTFGAFVTLKDGSTGLVHISEISDSYVRDVNDFLRVGQTVRVVELPSDEKTNNKKRLSIKRTGDVLLPLSESDRQDAEKKKSDRKEAKEAKKRDAAAKKDFSVPPPMFDEGRTSGEEDFGGKLARFMRDSEERLVDIKHQTENKRGGGYARR